MLYLKLMSGMDMPDACPAKSFKIVQLGDKDTLEFIETWSEPFTTSSPPLSATMTVSAVIYRENESRERYDLTGNAYVLNAQGKTIASRSNY
jgi:hypothetical protein